MSYPTQIDEIPTGQLTEELRRRKACLREGRCPYCRVLIADHQCKMRGKMRYMFEVDEVGRLVK